MNAPGHDLFQGPAVIIDDQINQPKTRAYAIATELEQAHIPVLRRTTIPTAAELRHWQSMSMIVLDWDLLPRISTDDPAIDSVGSSMPLGISVPSAAKGNPAIDAMGFVRRLMSELYCPVFIVSNLDPTSIKSELFAGLTETDRAQLNARVLVRSKKAEDVSLLEAVGDWVRAHPAIYALKVWERGYEMAKSALFRDLQASSVEWPGILWRTSDKDSVNPNHALTETITRSLQHRLNPSLFEENLILSEASAEDKAPLDSVRRVLHQQAVVPSTRLHDNVIMPGDFFYQAKVEDADTAGPNVPDSIEICITPACDLVARKGDSEDIRMLIVVASRVPPSEYSNRQKRDVLLPDDSATSVLLHHIVPDDAMYRVQFRDWYIRYWHEVKDNRRGRLLEPYVTLLQQRFAQYGQRQGVPRLPSRFYSAK